jgi:protein Tex
MRAAEFIGRHCHAQPRQIDNTIQLIDEGCTIPFIARYRKEKTGNLNEVDIATIAKYHQIFTDLLKRKAFIIESISAQGKLTESLAQSIQQCFDPAELEDWYLPYKKKKKSLASIAIEKGLEPLAKCLYQQESRDIEAVAESYIGDEVEDVASALKGACDIVAEWINEDAGLRKKLRNYYVEQAVISAKKSRKAADDLFPKYAGFVDQVELLKKCPSHRLLGLLRGEKESCLTLSVDIEEGNALFMIEKWCLRSNNSCTPYMISAIRDAFKRLIHPSLSNETLQFFRSKAEDDAIGVFSENLMQLLLSPPLGQKTIIALDPGFRTGCKAVCLNAQGDMIDGDTLYPHPPHEQKATSEQKLKKWVRTYQIEAIAIGNGTASRETQAWVKSIDFEPQPEIYVVNESGASIYSASEVGREEFPDLDVTVRGAISIGRRLADPLAELVKINPKSIGVGQYQHDVNEAKLQAELDRVVEQCVNKVGVNLNTASKHLLSYVSGIGPSLADKIVSYRSKHGPFGNREALKKVPRLGEKAFEQSAAFLKVPGSDNPLDQSFVHPESYHVVEKMARKIGCKTADLISNKAGIQAIPLQEFVTDTVGLPTLKDIITELEKPGLDPRQKTKEFSFSPLLHSFEDVKELMVVPGIITNITHFGCFVDIGIKENGLVHVSQIKSSYVSDIHKEVKINQEIMVKVLKVDKTMKKIQLSMIL